MLWKGSGDHASTTWLCLCHRVSPEGGLGWCGAAITTRKCSVRPTATPAHPTTTCQSHNLPCHQALPVLLLQSLRGLHCQHCSERLSWRCAGAAPPQQHTATLHRWIIIYRDLVVMCSTKKFHHFQDSLSSFYERPKYYLLVFSKHKAQRHFNIWFTLSAVRTRTLWRKLKNH